LSTLIVEVCEIEEVIAHPAADRLDKARVKNWWVIVLRDQFKVGDKAVYIPPDSVLPEEVAERFGIAKYCGQLPKWPDGSRPPGLRVRAARLRGEPSFGTLQPLENLDWPVGHSVLEHYGITKYEEPEGIYAGDSEPEIPGFHGYTNIENINNFPTVFAEDEEVVFEEKIHGTNSRVGLVRDGEEWKFVAGSHSQRRKEFQDDGKRSVYWFPIDDKMKALLQHLSDGKNDVVVFGEIYGRVQDMNYGVNLAYRAFDISVGMKYLDYTESRRLFWEYNIEGTSPLYRGPFSLAKVAEYTDGPTTLCDAQVAGKFTGREGIVIRPVKERYAVTETFVGRAILKSISVDYLSRKGGTERH
jgi:RNA ligase (TIGR02306 family)